MRQRWLLVMTAVGAAALAACGEGGPTFVDAPPSDPGATPADAGATPADASEVDATSTDAASPDAMPPDAAEPDAMTVDAAIDAMPIDAPPQTFYWADWTAATTGASGSATATFAPPSGTVQISYAGEVLGAQVSGGTNYWNPGAPYINFVTANAPDRTDIIRLAGNGLLNTVTFDRPVTGLVMAIVSLGQGGLTIRYDFDTSIVLLSEGRGYWGDGTMAVENGDTIRGNEGHGAIQFTQPVSSISWTVVGSENWHGFTLGIPNQ